MVVQDDVGRPGPSVASRQLVGDVLGRGSSNGQSAPSWRPKPPPAAPGEARPWRTRAPAAAATWMAWLPMPPVPPWISTSSRRAGPGLPDQVRPHRARHLGHPPESVGSSRGRRAAAARPATATFSGVPAAGEQRAHLVALLFQLETAGRPTEAIRPEHSMPMMSEAPGGVGRALALQKQVFFRARFRALAARRRHHLAPGPVPGSGTSVHSSYVRATRAHEPVIACYRKTYRPGGRRRG